MQNRLGPAAWLAGEKERFLRELGEIIAIPSVGAPENHGLGQPFGAECGRALDHMLEICRAAGLETRLYDHYAGAAMLPGETDERLGIFVHLDVVPAGEGWTMPPFALTERNGVLFGRGVRDDKGPALAALYALRYLRDTGRRLRHTVALVFGCNEESGMEDLRYYLTCEPAPAFSFTADAAWPVCHGEKGILIGELICPVREGGLVELYAGEVSNMVPAKARALIDCTPARARAALEGIENLTIREQNGGALIEAVGIGGHAAYPDGTDSALVRLLRALDGSGLLSGESAAAVGFLTRALGDYEGKGLNIDLRDAPSGRTTHIGGMVRLENGRLRQNINVRYAVTVRPEEVERRIAAAAEAGGFGFRRLSGSPPCYLPAGHPAIKALTALANEQLGTNLPPYTMGGGTYARLLPNAVAFGPERTDRPLPDGAGNCHQADEGIRWEDLSDAVCIYARALEALDRLV